MKTTLLAVLIVIAAGQAFAQTSITITPRGGDLTIDNDYVGTYGPDLPGVGLFRGRGLPNTPNTWDGGVRLPSYQQIENEQIYSQSELPYLDSWHGTLGGGFPF